MPLTHIFNLSYTSFSFIIALAALALGIFWTIKKARMNFIAWAYSIFIIFFILFGIHHPAISGNNLIHKFLSIELDEHSINFLRLIASFITFLNIFRLWCSVYYLTNRSVKKIKEVDERNIKTSIKKMKYSFILYVKALLKTIKSGKKYYPKRNIFCKKYKILDRIL